MVVYGLKTHCQLGDNVIVAGAVRNVKAVHPYLLFSREGASKSLWENNPDFIDESPQIMLPKVTYGSLEDEKRASHGNVVEGFTRTLCYHLGIPLVPIITRNPVLVLTDEEKESSKRWNGYWLLNANCQTYSRSKGYPHWQEVVNGLLDDIRIIQVGSNEDRNISPTLSGVIDYRGRSENLRHYLTMIYGCDGIISPPSGIMNIGAAFGKKMVIVNGAREPKRLTDYGNSIYVSTSCCGCDDTNGCISQRYEGSRACRNFVVRNHLQYSRCMDMIDPSRIIDAVRKIRE